MERIFRMPVARVYPLYVEKLAKKGRTQEELDEVILKCLRVDPSDRYVDVAELAIALVPFGDENAAARAEPQIQNAELSLDIPADCYDVNPLDTKNYVPGHNVQVETWSSPEPVATTSLTVLGLEFAERLPVREHVDVRPPSGVRRSLDRPPRV